MTYPIVKAPQGGLAAPVEVPRGTLSQTGIGLEPGTVGAYPVKGCVKRGTPLTPSPSPRGRGGIPSTSPSPSGRGPGWGFSHDSWRSPPNQSLTATRRVNMPRDPIPAEG
ncbi:hypothetical protein Mal52_56200 [Symmachiella dynata]|uniref:Uncharacterized protein n=1 Tax=Symmachiella dynata TaxID=2527995 RepID=A0A517ZX86_9PLAN|nr:hypothetical protein Mal52_56200 [Symmachiella dynata]